MKNQAAPHKDALKKRVNRFFQSSTQLRADVYGFVDAVTENDQFGVYVFGGLVRDIGLFGLRDFSSDIDLVVETDRKSLVNALSKLNNQTVVENKFGGFRIAHGAWCFDIWCARDTWAIKNRLVKYDDITSLLKTTFLSWDSALFDVRKQNLICNNDYLENLVNGSLDIVLQDSPNELGSMVRLTRAIYGKGAKELKVNALDTLKTYFKKYSFEEIISYECQSYSKLFLDLSKLESLRNDVESMPSGSSLRIKDVQLALPLQDIVSVPNTLHTKNMRNDLHMSGQLSHRAKLETTVDNYQFTLGLM